MTVIETTVENVLKGDRVSFHKDSEPRRVLSTYTDSGASVLFYDEAGMPYISKAVGTAVFVHFSNGDSGADR